ncbi:CHAT domain-containing protein [Tirmania nivea]|nr:CHAT domain-containing protein [Tirmania nivea]
MQVLIYQKKKNIWWIGVGLMAKAPIHAAAKYNKGSIKTTTLQYCRTSYTSTIRALQYSHSRARQYQKNPSMLIVTMPSTPGAGLLPSATKEADEIRHSLRNFITVETLEMPTAKCVLHALPRYSIAHFACHGVSSTNPADSHLLLLKGTGDVDNLRVKDIATLKLSTARLAYLSACSTASSLSLCLVDEVTHIVSSFHIAGFTNVIGTLWPAQDEACQHMATDFYSMLSKTDNVAISYRHAIFGLMKLKPSQPMYWAPFIHFGA